MMDYLQQRQMQLADAAARNQVPWYMRPPGMNERPEPVRDFGVMTDNPLSMQYTGMRTGTETPGQLAQMETNRAQRQLADQPSRIGPVPDSMRQMPPGGFARPPMGGYGGMMGMGLGQMFGMGGGYGRPPMPPQYGGGFGGGFPGMMGYGRPPMPPQMNPFGFGGGYGRPPMPQYGGFGMGFGGGFGGYQPQPQQFGGYGGMRTQPAQPQYQSQMQPPQQSPFGNPIAQRMGQAQQSPFGSPMRMY